MASFPANTTRMQTGQRDAAMPWPLKPAGTIISLPRGVGGWSGLLLRPAEVDFADARNGGDEWRIEFAREAAHFRESEFERVSHVLARHVAGGEDKFPDCMFREGTFFEQVVANAFVSRKQNPGHRTNQGEPSFIGSSARKVSEMALETDSKPSEGFLECAGVAEVFVEV